MRLVAFHKDRDAQPFTPCALGQFFDLFLAAEEFALTVFGVQQEALKVAEAVKDQSGDLARERLATFAALNAALTVVCVPPPAGFTT